MSESSEDQLIDCINQAGEPMRLPRKDFGERPAAYAVIERDGSLLAFKLPTGKFFLPGGGLDIGESPVDGLLREVREEIGGLKIVVREPLGIFEHFYYYDDTQSAWHGVSHVFMCDFAPGFDEIPVGAGEKEEGYPEWVRFEALTPEVLHPGIMGRVLEAYHVFRSHTD